MPQKLQLAMEGQDGSKPKPFPQVSVVGTEPPGSLGRKACAVVPLLLSF